MSAPTLIAEVRADLVQYAPFSQFEPPLLDHLASRLELEYFRHGELIVGPGPDVPEACFIVRQGVVEVSSPGEVGDWVIHSTVSTPAMTATTVWAASFCFEVRPPRSASTPWRSRR